MNYSPKRIFRVLMIMVVVFLAVFGTRWYNYITNTKTPYDEEGIEINRRLPAPLRNWGCQQLEATFTQLPPPIGCRSDDNPLKWRG
ncbi:hypothetical protein NAC44_11465 [Allorhizobium sp. BGMRC 0089]|uniref:hypothetical protein n=1 Tax=Allorhizobium sonneratiae TaxID=2934936 RepID=UPI0020343F20|nr:hypothetical protein [Allorhizobium sonneratiae]MCM2292941.1 hypothetical protein [Allorhizobium sonneratiae]